MWLVHFGHFVGAVFGVFFGAIGDTFLGMLIHGAFATSIAIAALHRKKRTEGWGAMLSHWRQEYRPAVKFAMWSALFIYGPVIVWSVGKAAYEDHQDLVGRSRQQRTQLRADASKMQQQSNEDLSKLNSCENEGARIGGQNDALNKQNRDQQNTINNCQTQAMKLLTPEPFKMVSQFLVSVPWHNGTHQLSLWIVIPNKTVTPVALAMQCSVPILSADAEVLGAVVLSGRPTRISETKYDFSIPDPAWSPSAPIKVEVVFAPNTNPSCSFQ